MLGPVLWMHPQSHPHPHSHQIHAPHRPSPLATRSLNVCSFPQPYQTQSRSPTFFPSSLHAYNRKMADTNATDTDSDMNDENATIAKTLGAQTSPLAPRNNTTTTTTSAASQTLSHTVSQLRSQAPRQPSQAPRTEALSPKQALPLSKRQAKPNPLLEAVGDRDRSRQSRRELFLRRVQRDREDKRWEDRSDEIMRLNSLQYRRRREAEQERLAVQLQSKWADRDEEDLDVGLDLARLDLSTSQQHMHPHNLSPRTQEMEVEKMLRQEGEEMEALVAMMEGWEGDEMQNQQQSLRQQQQHRRELHGIQGREQSEQQQQWGGGDVQPRHQGSEEEDFDSMLMDYFGQDPPPVQNLNRNNGSRETEQGDADSMDVN